MIVRSGWLNRTRRSPAMMNRVDARTLTNGTTSPLSCESEGCVDGVVLRGNFTDFSVREDGCTAPSGALQWNAMASDVKSAIEECSNHTRQVRAMLCEVVMDEWVALTGAWASRKHCNAFCWDGVVSRSFSRADKASPMGYMLTHHVQARFSSKRKRKSVG